MIAEDWSFKSDDVAQSFMDHVRGQLPFYDLVTKSICKIARNFIKENYLVYDVGCSTGNMAIELKPLLEKRNALYCGLDNSPSLLSLNKLSKHPNMNFIEQDVCDYEYQKFDFCIVNLTLMFLDPEKREVLIQTLRQKCKKHGAIVITEKIYPPDGFYSTINNRLLWNWKMENNTAEDVIKKELSLEGIQVPLMRDELKGFSEWFRFGDFSSYIYIKEA